MKYQIRLGTLSFRELSRSCYSVHRVSGTWSDVFPRHGRVSVEQTKNLLHSSLFSKFCCFMFEILF